MLPADRGRLYKDDVPNVEVGVQVNGSVKPAGHVVPDAITHRESGHDLTRMSDAVPAAGDSLD